ncbi:MAG: sulfatase [Akkermansiaceae bacterium]|nr:sulfatase [Akkermansiaceae bacterium]
MSLIKTILILFVGVLSVHADRPNVLFIAIDDLRPELGCYGAGHIQSPHIDRLAARGVRFSSAHVQQAICMASRASILSGLRPEKQGIYTGESVSKLIPDVLTLNRFFEQNGYTIASCGKIYHHGSDTKEQFGDAEMTPNKTWTGRGYVTPEAIEKIKLNTEHQRGPAYESADVDDTVYKDGANTRNAVKRMAELSQNDKPFFLAVGLSKPHLPFVAPSTYWDLYPIETIKKPSLRTRPLNSSEYTMRTRGELNNYYGIPYLYEDIDEDTMLTLRRAYYACVSYADAQVGKLLDQVEKLGLAENTIIVLWGDHGYKLGDYGSWCKWSNMRLDTRIPLIFSVPKGMRGAVCDTPVEALDIYPTLAALCGLEKPAHLDGESLTDCLEHPESERSRDVYSIWPHSRDKYDKTVMGYSVKDGRFNYVEWLKLSSGELLARELYDHSNDPDETINVVDDKANAAIVAELAKKLALIKDGTDHDHRFR